MYTQEPNWFDEPDHDSIEKEIDKTYPDYEDSFIDWDYLHKLEKKQIFYDNIDNLLKKYNFRYKFYSLENKYRIWFKDQYDLNKFNMLKRKSKILKNLEPWRIYNYIDSCGCMDYYIKKY